MAAEAASPDWNEANRTGSLIEQGTTRRTEFQHQSRPRQHRAYANRDGSWWPVGDLKAGSGESFLIGGFLAVAFFFFLLSMLSKIGVRVLFARKLHAHEQNYRRKGKGELNREAEEGISVHATEWRRGKEKRKREGRE